MGPPPMMGLIGPSAYGMLITGYPGIAVLPYSAPVLYYAA